MCEEGLTHQTEQEEKELTQETNFVMYNMILFLNFQSYRQDLCDWMFVDSEEEEGGVLPWISMAQRSGY